MDPNVTQPLFQLYRAGDFDSVEQRTRALLTAHPKEPMLHSLHGTACLELGQFEAAIQSYRQALALRPGLAKVHNSLGIAYLRTGRLEAAAESFGNAIDNDAQFAEPRFNLGLILENRQRPGEAANAYHHATQLDPGYCKAWCALAKVCWQMGQFEQVADYYERALAVDAGFVPAHRGLLQFLEQSNRHDELRAATRRAGDAMGTKHPLVRYHQGVIADIDGRGLEARSLLESCRQEPTDPLPQHDERLRLARLTGLCDRLNDIEAAVHYAGKANRLAQNASLAKGIDKVGFLRFIENRKRYYTRDNIESWRWDEPHIGPKPKTATAALPSQQAAGDTRRDKPPKSRAGIAACPPEHGTRPPRFEGAPNRGGEDGARDESGPSERDQESQRIPPVFIVGFPRSGTTLIDTMLRGHPAVAVAEESAALPQMVNQLCGPSDEHLESLGELSGAAIEQARNTYMDTLGRDIRTTGRRDAGAGGAPASANRAGRRLPPAAHTRFPQGNEFSPDDDAANPSASRVRGNAAPAPARRTIDRFALNIVYAGEIHRIFPNAKFILMLRHPADAVLSCYLRSFVESSANASFHNLEDAAHLYDQVLGLWHQVADLFVLDVAEIKYEDLLADPERTSRKVLQFVDLPWHPGVLDHEQTARTRHHIRTASYNQVIQPLYSDAAGRWRRYRSHLKPILSALEPWTERFGYD